MLHFCTYTQQQKYTDTACIGEFALNFVARQQQQQTYHTVSIPGQNWWDSKWFIKEINQSPSPVSMVTVY